MVFLGFIDGIVHCSLFGGKRGILRNDIPNDIPYMLRLDIRLLCYVDHYYIHVLAELRRSSLILIGFRSLKILRSVSQLSSAPSYPVEKLPTPTREYWALKTFLVNPTDQNIPK